MSENKPTDLEILAALVKEGNWDRAYNQYCMIALDFELSNEEAFIGIGLALADRGEMTRLKKDATTLANMLHLFFDPHGKFKQGGGYEIKASDLLQSCEDHEIDLSMIFKGGRWWEYNHLPDDVLKLWDEAELSEGGASMLLGVDRIQARVMLEEWKAKKTVNEPNVFLQDDLKKINQVRWMLEYHSGNKVDVQIKGDCATFRWFIAENGTAYRETQVRQNTVANMHWAMLTLLLQNTN